MNPQSYANYKQIEENEIKTMESDGFYKSPDQKKNGATTWEKFIKEPRERSRWTRDNVGAPSRIRQLGNRFALVQLSGEKPAIVRKIPYYERQEFSGTYDTWEP